jgi:hypothetical protein
MDGGRKIFFSEGGCSRELLLELAASLAAH